MAVGHESDSVGLLESVAVYEKLADLPHQHYAKPVNAWQLPRLSHHYMKPVNVWQLPRLSQRLTRTLLETSASVSRRHRGDNVICFVISPQLEMQSSVCLSLWPSQGTLADKRQKN